MKWIIVAFALVGFSSTAKAQTNAQFALGRTMVAAAIVTNLGGMLTILADKDMRDGGPIDQQAKIGIGLMFVSVVCAVVGAVDFYHMKTDMDRRQYKTATLAVHF
jgi:hypothetical protein